jgi:adenine phosphoribosyltransferase
MDLKQVIRTVPDFPKPGIGFKDITPILQQPDAFRASVEAIQDLCPADEWDSLLAIESRGFLFGSALALALGKPLNVARKPGKLPWKTIERRYELEYGEDSLHVHVDAFRRGERVLVIDDLLATGGTLEAACLLVRDAGADPVFACCVVELDFLPGRERMEKLGVPLRTLVHYASEEE